jgi:hypothetical protein
MPGTYSAAHKRYYEAHREEIREQRKAADRAYYERNKERIKARVLDKYYQKKGVIPNVPSIIILEIPADQEVPVSAPAAEPLVASV